MHLNNGIVILLEFNPSHHLASRHFGKIVVQVEAAPEAIVILFPEILITIVLHFLAEVDGEIDVVLPCPAVGDAVAGQRVRVFHPQGGPQHLAVVVIETVVEIHDELLGFALGVGVFVDAAVRGGGELHENVVVAEAHLVVAR